MFNEQIISNESFGKNTFYVAILINYSSSNFDDTTVPKMSGEQRGASEVKSCRRLL